MPKIGMPKMQSFGGSIPGADWLGEKATDIWNVMSGDAAARDAGKEEKKALDKQLAFARETRDQQMALNEPWMQLGKGAVGQLSDLSQFEFTPEEYQAPAFDFQADPGYQFRLAEGQKALERSAAARGGLFGAGTVRRLSDLSGQMASDEYGRAQQRYSQDRQFGYGVYSDKQNARRQALNDRFSRLSSLAGFGEAATGRMGQAQGAFGQAAGTNALDRGNVNAARIVGCYNAQRDTAMGLGQLAAPIIGGL
ncbi:hypothetical protein KJ865_13020 [Myxococcota bacterium]|nr:hypothetical protein [Myxococcota bacterium]